MMPGRHVAGPGEKSETPGVELEPSEMEVLINKDRASWVMRATKLHEAGVAVLQAIDAKDSQKVFEVGEQIEQACENCHRQCTGIRTSRFLQFPRAPSNSKVKGQDQSKVKGAEASESVCTWRAGHRSRRLSLSCSLPCCFRAVQSHQPLNLPLLRLLLIRRSSPSKS